MTREEKIKQISNAMKSLNHEINEQYLDNGLISLFENTNALYHVILTYKNEIIIEFNVMATHLIVAEVVDRFRDYSLELAGFDIFYYNPNDEKVYYGEDAFHFFNEIINRGESNWTLQ